MIADVVAQADVDAVWPIFAADVAKCLKKTPTPDYSAGDYWTMCRSGMAFLIAVHDQGKFKALTVWRFEDDYFCCLMMVGKNMGGWVGPLFEKAAEVSRNGGCSGRLRGDGRVGFEGVFKRHFPSVRIIRQTYEVTI